MAGHNAVAGLRPSPRRTWFLSASLLIAFIAAVPLLEFGGLLNTRGGGDSPFLLQRVHQLVSALAGGHFPVRWMPDAAYGYGYPFFNFYAPLSIYVAAFFRFLGAAYTTAIQLAQLAAFLLAASATFQLARRWLRSDWAGLLASAAYTLAPFHMVNVYVRGDSLAEFWAMALYPLVLLAADLISRKPAVGGLTFRESIPIAFLALAYAALVLSHNISALIFSPFLLLYILLATLRRSDRRRRLTHAAAALLLGLLLSAWFWIPALAETPLVQTEPVTAGYFFYGNHFRGSDLLQKTFLFNYDVAGQAAFRMGLVQALLIVAGLLALLWRAYRRLEPDWIPATFIVATLAIATFMITPLSRPLWDNLPLLPYVQFPWRFLSVQALAGAVATGALALLPARRLWLIAAVAVLLLAMLPSLQVDHLTLSDADVTPLRLAEYEWFTGNIGTTVSAEYLPDTVQPRPYTSPWLNRGERDLAQALSGVATAQLSSRRATQQRWQVEVTSGDGAVLEFPTFYWPGWQARIDGVAADATPTPGSGLIAVQVPAGAHTVELALRRTPIRLAAELVSLAALLGLVALFAVEILRFTQDDGNRHPERDPFMGRLRSEGSLRALVVTVTALILLFVVLRLLPQRTYEPNTLTWDFAQMGYLHHAPAGIAFGDGAWLAGYGYSAETVAPGETLRVQLDWQEHFGDGGAAALALVTPAVHRYEYAAPLLAVQQPLQDDQNVFELPVPAGAPPGLYVLRLERDRSGVQPETPSGQTRGALFLRPVRIVARDEQEAAQRNLAVRLEDVALPVTLPAIDPAAEGLFDCAAGDPSPGSLQLHLSWFTQRPLGPNYIVSLRLNGADGARIAQCDVQPGYGHLPSGSWQAGRWLPDRLALPLPPVLPQSPQYALLVTLYDGAGTTALTRRLGQLQWQDGALVFAENEPQFTLPPDIDPAGARFGEAIALRGYELAQDGGSLQITLYWQALKEGQADYVRFVHLLDDASGAPLAQADGAPQNGSYPTGQWIEGEIVADAITLDASTVSAGEVQIAVGFYPVEDPTARLPVYDGEGRLLPDGRLIITPHE